MSSTRFNLNIKINVLTKDGVRSLVFPPYGAIKATVTVARDTPAGYPFYADGLFQGDDSQVIDCKLQDEKMREHFEMLCRIVDVSQEGKLLYYASSDRAALLDAKGFSETLQSLALCSPLNKIEMDLIVADSEAEALYMLSQSTLNSQLNFDLCTELAEFQLETADRIDSLCRNLRAIFARQQDQQHEVNRQLRSGPGPGSLPTAHADFVPSSSLCRRRVAPQMKCPIEQLKAAGATGDKLDEWVDELVGKMVAVGGDAGKQRRAAREWLMGPALLHAHRKLHSALLPLVKDLGIPDGESGVEDRPFSQEPYSSKCRAARLFMALDPENSSKEGGEGPEEKAATAPKPSAHPAQLKMAEDKAKVPMVPDTADRVIPAHMLAQGPKNVQMSMAVFDDQVLAVPPAMESLFPPPHAKEAPKPTKKSKEEAVFLRSPVHPKPSSLPGAPPPPSSKQKADEDEDWVVT